MRIRYRLLIGFFLLIGIGFYYLINWVIDDLRPRYLESVEESLVDEANILAEIVSEKVQGDSLKISEIKTVFSRINNRLFEAQIYKLKKERVDLRVYITNSNGIVIFDSDNGEAEGKDYSRWRDVYLTLRGKYGARSSDRIPNVPSTSTLYVASPIIHMGNIIGVLTVCKPTTNINFFIESAKPKIMVAGYIAAISIIVLSFILSTWITLPIKKLTDYARKIRDGTPVQVPKIKGGEVGDLAKAFEEMRDALEGKKYVEQYIQTLTHELKSPLSGIRGASELLQEQMPEEKRMQFLQNIESDTNRIQEVVDRMLQLASLESRKKLEEYTEFDVNEMIEGLIKGFEPQIKSRNIDISLNLGEGIILKGENFLIRKAITNLLHNALDFSPEKSRVTVSTSISKQEVNITVKDEGPGIPDYAMDKIFEKFYSLPRPDTKVKSSGLGLNFIKHIMDLHSGTIVIENNLKGGVIASLIFPSKTTTK